MSGIAGIYQLDGRPVAPERLTRMTSAVAYRGPDRSAQWVEGSVGLAHLAFDTTPEALNETQPLVDRRSSLSVTLDGRVDNRAELLAQLASAGADVRSGTDAEIVLRAYETWGARCATRIIGDFAFVIWDARRRQLVCARDPLGFRPLCYHAGVRAFVFGSEPRQLFEAGALSPEPSEAMIGEYLAGGITSCEETLFEGVRRVPPGHVLIAGQDGIRTHRYWPTDTGRTIAHADDDAYAEELRAIVDEAVRCRLRSHGPVAAELSGGLDSSSVVATAAALSRGAGAGPEPETFSLLFFGRDCDESTYVRDVTERWNLRSHTLDWSEPGVDSWKETVRRHMDVPTYPNAAMARPLRALARTRGFRVLLTGNGGDQWLTGSPRLYADLLRGGRLSTLLRELRHDGADPAVALPSFPLLRLGLWPLMPAPVHDLLRWTRRGRDLPPWLGRDFVERVDLRDRLRRPDDGLTFSSLAQRDLFRMSTSGLDVHFAEMDERSASALGVETRHPLMDRRVVEFAMALPGEQRRQRGLSKFVLRRALADRLPASVAQRTAKAEFSHAFPAAFRALGGEDAFASLRIASLGWVDGERVRSMYRRMSRRFDAGDRGYAADVWPLWRTLAIELWFTTIFESTERPWATAVR